MSFWNKLNIILAILSTIGCILAFVFSIYAYYFQLYVPERIGVITPDNESTPKFSKSCKPSDNATKIYFGSNLFFWEDKQKFYIVSFYGNELIKIEETPQGLYINATIYREDGRLVATVVDNQFTVNPNQYFKLESRDHHELRIEGKEGTLLLYIRYLNEKSILIEGVLAIQGKSPITIDSDWVDSNNNHIGDSCAENMRREDSSAFVKFPPFDNLLIYGEP